MNIGLRIASQTKAAPVASVQGCTPNAPSSHRSGSDVCIQCSVNAVNSAQATSEGDRTLLREAAHGCQREQPEGGERQCGADGREAVVGLHRGAGDQAEAERLLAPVATAPVARGDARRAPRDGRKALQYECALQSLHRMTHRARSPVAEWGNPRWMAPGRAGSSCSIAQSSARRAAS